MTLAYPFVGIDFGTSKSAVAAYNPQDAVKAETIRCDGKDDVPSIVYIVPRPIGTNQSDRIRVGQLAERELERAVTIVTTTGKDVPYLKNFFINVKQNLTKEAGRSVEGETYTPEFVVSQILGRLKHYAEQGYFRPEGAERSISRVVITHPASFGDREKGKIEVAAKSAGFTTIRFVSEPVAAAIAYSYSDIPIGQYTLIYDFGAGTFDVAALRRDVERSFTQVVTPKGSNQLGGDRIDRILYDYLDSKAQKQVGVSFNKGGLINLALLRYCRNFKEDLSIQPDPQSFQAYIQAENGPKPFEYTMDQAEFEGIIRPNIQETIKLTQEVIEEAKSKGCQIDTLVLVGGSSKLPLVKTMLQESLPQVSVRTWHKQHIAVALGAALYAGQQWEALCSEYRQAVSNVWGGTKSLTPEQAQELRAFAASKGLTADEAALIEYAVMGITKEEDLERQYRLTCDRYRSEVVSVLQSKTFTRGQLGALMAQEKELSIRKTDAESIEVSVFDKVKQQAWDDVHKTNLANYRSQIAGLMSVQFPEPGRAQTLDNAARGLDLLQGEAVAIESEMLGDTKENYIVRKHQEALAQYRSQVQAAWSNRQLTRVQVNDLAMKAKEWHLSNEEAANIEVEVLSYTKERRLTIQTYTRDLQSAWKNKRLTVEQVHRLEERIREMGMPLDVAASIEREVMGGYPKEMILKRQIYRDAVQAACQSKIMTLSRYDALITQRKKLGFSDPEAESIEKEEMNNDTALNHYNRHHKVALDTYREAVEAVRMQTNVLDRQATTLELSPEEITTIHREVMPSLLPPKPIRANKIVPFIFFTIGIAMTGGGIGFAIGQSEGDLIKATAVVGVLVTVLSLVWFLYNPKPRTRSTPDSSLPQQQTSQLSAPTHQQRQQ